MHSSSAALGKGPGKKVPKFRRFFFPRLGVAVECTVGILHESLFKAAAGFKGPGPEQEAPETAQRQSLRELTGICGRGTIADAALVQVFLRTFFAARQLNMGSKKPLKNLKGT